jgi:hypothetical protein
MRATLIAAGLCWPCLSLASGASPPERKPLSEAFDAWGELRLRLEQLDDFAVDDAGTPHGQEKFWTSRVRAGALFLPHETVRLTLEFEALSGIASGDTTDLGTSAGNDVFRRRRDTEFGTAGFRLRQASLGWDTPIGRLIVGQQAFLWGTGMLAHDGTTASDFGDAQQGNLVYRAAFVTQPQADFRLFVGADLVASDDNASYSDGDRAVGGVVGLRWEPRPELAAGLLTGWRAQEDRADALRPDAKRSRVDVLTGDLYLRWRALPAWTFEAEGAVIAGTTTRPYLEETRGEAADVRSFGALLRARYDDDALRLTAKLDLGLASGDDDPRDADVHAFTFNSDFGAGLVLFEHVLPLVTARSIDRVNDPELLNRAPSGLRFTVNQGAVTNAVFVHPRVLWRPIEPVDLRLGWMPAWAPADVSDVYASARNGGFNTTAGGRSPGGHFYGHEVEAAARGRLALSGPLALHAGVEAGVFFPGSAFDGLGLDTITLVRGLAEVTW